MFVKLGQMASTRADLVPADVRDELSLLQSHVEPVPAEAMRAELEAELGGSIDQNLSEFDWKPIGTASIAHACAARLTSGEPVVVKVQRPEIEELLERDSKALLQLARALERRTPPGRELRITEMADEFVRSLHRELDFQREAASTVALASATPADSHVRIPHIYASLGSRRVLVEERFQGQSAQNRGRIAELGLDEVELADRLVATMVGHLLQGDFTPTSTRATSSCSTTATPASSTSARPATSTPLCGPGSSR